MILSVVVTQTISYPYKTETATEVIVEQFSSDSVSQVSTSTLPVQARQLSLTKKTEN